MPRDDCPVCDLPGSEPFVYRPAVPVHLNLLCPSVAAARGIRRGVLDMRVCPGCGFVFNAAFDPGLLDYGPGYENSQDHSPAFQAHVDALVEHLVTARGVRNGRVVEVGCGQGRFLTRLLGHPDNRSEGVGFDPAYVGPECLGRARFVRDFYGPTTAVAADVVVCRHVIEHVPDPMALLRTIRFAARGPGPIRLFLETPCVEWVLRNRVVWDFFYEHCSLFTAASLTYALRRAGWAVVAIGHVFGGQYLWAEAVSANDAASVAPPPCTTGTTVWAEAQAFAAAEAAQRNRWYELLATWTARGPVYAWGAGAKGVTFCNLADPDAMRIAGVVDINPAKQGCFLPGTAHPIVNPSAAVAAGAVACLVLNPNYLAEVRDVLTRSGSEAVAIDLTQETAACGW